MVDYQSTADKKLKIITDKPQKNLKKVVTGEVVVSKPGIGARFKKIFFGGDMDTAVEHVVGTVILPAIRNVIVEAVSKGIDQLIYGENRRPNRPPSYGPRIQYHNPGITHMPPRGYLADRPSARWAESSRTANRVTVMTRADADAVVDQMIEIVEKYGVASMSDLNEILGLESTHVDNAWGWDNLARIEVRQTKDGYDITFPPVEEVQQ